ncbi:MAG TPA: DUF2339 domain-containing protein [Blastocatellia bacterium]|nr:DUF2339 domain-containing protein [Blastocatellia bacterium]
MAEDKSSQDRIEQLTERVNYLESIVRDQIGRIYALERQAGLAARPSSPPLEITPPLPQPLPPSPTASTDTRANAQPQARTAAPRERTSARLNEGRGNLEERIGGNWFNRIGMLAIALGVGMFLKYAFDNEWIGPSGRVIIGLLIGVGFLASGELLRRRGYQSYSAGLSGGGILILYLSIYASFAFYQLIGQLPAFFLMALVTTAAALLAARYDALPIAVLGLIGGFLTPILLSTGVDNQAGLFGYIALLDAGVLALAYRKQWRSLNYMAFAATTLMMLAWLIEWYDWFVGTKLGPTIFFLTLFFGIFALLSVFYNVINREAARWPDLILTFLNAVFYFGMSYLLLDDDYERYLGLFAVLVSAFYLGLGYLTYRTDREDRLLVFTFLGLAFLFLVLAVPIQFEQRWVTMGWAIEGAVLTYIGLRVDDRTSRYAALGVFAIATLHWFLLDVSGPASAAGREISYSPFNARALAGAVLILSLSAAAWLYRRYGSRVAAEERSTFTSLFIFGANALAVTLLSIEANDYFERRMFAEGAGANFDRLDNSRQFTLTALWSVYGAAMMVVGITRKLRLLRYAAFALLSLAALKVIVADLRYYDAAWHVPLLNQTFASFAVLAAALACGAWYYSRSDRVDAQERNIAPVALFVGANLLLLIALSAESSGYFEGRIHRQQDGTQDLELARQLSLSMIWMVYGGVLLTIGILRRSKLLRLMGLTLLSVTILKVFLWDLSSLEKLYRIISFIVLGAILLAVSFLYQRLRLLALVDDLKTEGEPPDSARTD